MVNDRYWVVHFYKDLAYRTFKYLHSAKQQRFIVPLEGLMSQVQWDKWQGY